MNYYIYFLNHVFCRIKNRTYNNVTKTGKTTANEKKKYSFCDKKAALAFNKGKEDRDAMDEHPFIELTERHAAAIDSVCRSFCSVKEDREDLRQEILLHLWQGWKRYRPEHRPITWLYRVALNTAISWRRQKKKQTETLPLDGFDLPEDTVMKEQAAHLKALIAMLPAADQRLINLYLDGFTTDEIARLLCISQTNVTTRIGRIKEKLRNIVNSV